MHVLILTALLPEARAIARALHLPARFSQATIHGPHQSVSLIGPGAKNLDAIAALQPQALIMAGLAGALAPDLAVGDVVIQGAHPPLKTMPHRIWNGNLAYSRAIVATPAAKAALWRATGALAVDMETQPVQQYAQTLNLPFLAVRAISDCAADFLDPALLSLIDTQGRPRVGRALMHLASHPAKLPAMMRIRRSTNIALSHLAVTLAAIITSDWPKAVNNEEMNSQ